MGVEAGNTLLSVAPWWSWVGVLPTGEWSHVPLMHEARTWGSCMIPGFLECRAWWRGGTRTERYDFYAKMPSLHIEEHRKGKSDSESE